MKLQGIKMVVSDLDGTLLKDDKSLSDFNLKMISRLKEKKILFTIASGRPIGSILLQLKKWHIEEYLDFIIHTNGYGLYDYHNKIDHTFHKLNKACIKDIIDKYLNDNRSLMDYDGYHIDVTKENETSERVKSYNDLKVNIKDIECFKVIDLPKLMICANQTEIDKLEIEYRNLHNQSLYKGFKSASDIFEFVDYRISKAFALDKLIKMLKLEDINCIAFGDSDNDIEILTYLLNSVAMDNASDKVKAIAKFKTFSNNEDGFGKFIQEKIL